jgi:hypothetical protein
VILGDCEGVEVDFARLTELCRRKGDRCSPTRAVPAIAADHTIVADEIRWNRTCRQLVSGQAYLGRDEGGFRVSLFYAHGP